MKLLNVVIPSRNFDASVRFYRDILGLPMRHEALGCCFLSAGAVNLAIHVAREESDTAPTGHATYLDFSVINFDQVKTHLQSVGVTIKKEWKDDSGRFLQVLDPDGNLVELVG
jgi:catechol 2,3-dioxygenase-like lactoylglutathione lyase family enzyme